MNEKKKSWSYLILVPVFVGYAPNVSCSEDEEDVDEHRVKDISFKIFYRSHRIIALGICVTWIFLNLYWSRNLVQMSDKLFQGFICMSGIFVLISTLLYPNGPFIRPHPIVWRIVLSVGVIYLSIVIFCLFLDHEDVRNLLIYLDSNLNISGLELKNYAEDCSFTWRTIKPQLDFYCVIHFLGWFAKALIIRHSAITWFFSIMWELSELFFQHLLPNFKECWWDIVLLDILICNGLGIYAGSLFLRWIECRTFHWESVKMIKGTSGKLKRFILQFSPMNVETTNWLGTSSITRRILFLTLFCVFWQTSELNAFFLKHIYWVDARHPFCIIRSIISILLALPTTRQFYEYVTSPRIRTLGIYPWLFIIITLAELFLTYKHGSVFVNLRLSYLGLWFLTQFLASVLTTSVAIFFKNAKYFKRKSKTA